jgi:hypothetical protein
VCADLLVGIRLEEGIAVGQQVSHWVILLLVQTLNRLHIDQRVHHILAGHWPCVCSCSTTTTTSATRTDGFEALANARFELGGICAAELTHHLDE